jgi:glycosyltransferase 2 family protein
MKNNRKWFLRVLTVLILGGLLYWALRNAPLAEIWAAIRHLRPWQIALLVLLNALLYVLITLRWWIIVQAEARRVAFWPLLAVRLAVFGVSYFTLGPQVGGEPLQVLSLQRKYGISYTRATASVLMDKLLEFLVNFLLLAVGLTAIFQAGILPENGMQVTGSLVFLVALILWPPIHIFLMYRRIYPLTSLMRFLPKNARPVRFLRAAEWLAGTFCQRHPRALLGALAVSLLAGIGMLVDYGLMTSFLGIRLPFWKIVAGWTAGWLSFLVPLPGGLGALEASQVFALGAFGIPAAMAISVTLLMRARDLLIGGLGLLLAGQGFTKAK